MSFRYSIIVPHYDGSIDDKTFIRGMYCLLNQIEQNFEVLLYHDGPTSRSIPDVYKQFGDRCRLTITESRDNDWGHSNRDRGIKSAKGEYIVHFNPDNILYHDALFEVSKLIDDTSLPMAKHNGKIIGSNNIIIMPVYMIGHFRYGLPTLFGARIKPEDSPKKDHKMIFTGDPCVFANIDCMQLIMKTELWLNYGGWYDKRSFGDGFMYQEFVSDHGARYADKILGEHH
jgi:hypothetical protein